MSKKKGRKIHKKEEFQRKGGKDGNFSRTVLFLFIASLVLAGGVVYLIQAKKGSAPSQALQLENAQGYQIENIVNMRPIKANVEGESLVISLDEVKKNKLVRFEYDRSKNSLEPKILPLLAYISPSGNLITAVSMCEPCRSTSFHFEPDKTITCDACGTKWDIETLQGVSGACLEYSPDPVKAEVKGDKIYIPLSELNKWQLRI